MKYLWLSSSAIKACHVPTVLLISLSIYNNEHENQGAIQNSMERTWKLLISAASIPICHYYRLCYTF
jgi:hypothetical protein